jgi:hypothetical protein
VNTPFLIILSNIFAHAISNAFFVEILIVDWLNLIGSIVASDNKVNCLLVFASPKPLAAIIVPFSAFVNLTCKPKRVTKLSLIPSFKLIVSSSDTE